MNPYRDLRDLPRPIWLIALAVLINRVGTMALPFLALYLTRAEHESLEFAGVAMSVLGIASMAAGPWAGRLADRFGPNRMMPVSLIASGAMMALIPCVHSRPLVLLVVTGWAIASAGFNPASSSVVISSAPPALRKQAFALIRLAVNLGMSVGPAVGGLLAEHSFPSLFWINATASIAAGLVLARLQPGSEVRATSVSPVSRRGLLRDPAIRAYLIGTTAIALVFFQGESALPLYLVSGLGLSEATYGGLFTLNTAMIVLMEVPLNSAMAHWETRRSLALGAFLVAVGFGAMALWSTVWGVAVSVMVWTFGEMIFSPSSAAFPAELVEADRVGEVMGLYSSAWGLAFAVAPILGTLGLDKLGGHGHWIATLSVGLVGTALLWRGVAPSPRPLGRSSEATA